MTEREQLLKELNENSMKIWALRDRARIAERRYGDMKIFSGFLLSVIAILLIPCAWGWLR